MNTAFSSATASPAARASPLARLLRAGAVVACIAVALLCAHCTRQTVAVHTPGTGGIVEREVRTDGEVRSYHVYLPTGVDTGVPLPVLLYLHASGADGGVWDIAGPLGAELRANPERFPCIIVFPRCPMMSYWIGPMTRYAIEAMRRTADEFHGDTSRLLVSGESMGGYGALICAIDNPGVFAAVAPVCGGVVPPVQFSPRQERQLSPACWQVLDAEDPYAALASLLGDTPVWLFHGSADDAVPVTESRNIEAALKANAGNVSYTELQGMGHGIGREAYGDEQFLTWLFSQRRTASPTQ